MARGFTDKAKKCAELEILHPDASAAELAAMVGSKRANTIYEWRKMPEFQAAKDEFRKKHIVRRLDKVLGVLESRTKTLNDGALVQLANQLGKMMGFNTEKHEFTGPGSGPITVVFKPAEGQKPPNSSQ